MKKILILSLLVSFTFAGFTQQLTKTIVCVIQNGVLKDVEIDYNPATGDRTIVIDGVRKNFHDVYPKSGPEYAQGQAWYTNNEIINFNGRPYKKYGLPRVLAPQEILKTGVYKGVGVYAEPYLTGIVEVIYIPVRQGCEFQPYQINCDGTVQIEKINSTPTTLQFTAKISGLTGNISYDWQSQGIPIIKGQGTSSVTLDVKNSYDGEKVYLTVVVMDAKNCPVSDGDGTFITKQSVAANSKWSASDRKDFVDACIKSTTWTEEKGRSYCICMLEKIEKAYPNPATLEKEFKKEGIDAWAKECMPKADNR